MSNITCPYCNLYQDMPVAAMAREPSGGSYYRAVAFCRTCKRPVFFRTDETQVVVREQYPPGAVQQAPTELPDKVKKSYAEALVCFATGVTCPQF